MTTPDQQTALEGAVVAEAWFVELHFDSGVQRLCNFNKPFVWGGYTWQGLGSLVQMSEIKTSEKIEPNPVTFNLNLAQPEWLAFGVGAVEEYRGLPALIYYCPLTPEHLLIDEPELVWNGDMDVIAVSVAEDGGGTLTLRCEPQSKRLRRRNVQRVNAANQKLKYPTDTGFDYQADLLAKPQLWLSKRFQQI